jgi:hypothetical protein
MAVVVFGLWLGAIDAGTVITSPLGTPVATAVLV